MKWNFINYRESEITKKTKEHNTTFKKKQSEIKKNPGKDIKDDVWWWSNENTEEQLQFKKSSSIIQICFWNMH